MSNETRATKRAAPADQVGRPVATLACGVRRLHVLAEVAPNGGRSRAVNLYYTAPRAEGPDDTITRFVASLHVPKVRALLRALSEAIGMLEDAERSDEQQQPDEPPVADLRHQKEVAATAREPGKPPRSFIDATKGGSR